MIQRNETAPFPQCADHVVISAFVAAGTTILMLNYRGISGYGQRFTGYSRRDIGLYDPRNVNAMK